jgi:hypothetical protein
MARHCDFGVPDHAVALMQRSDPVGEIQAQPVLPLL